MTSFIDPASLIIHELNSLKFSICRFVYRRFRMLCSSVSPHEIYPCRFTTIYCITNDDRGGDACHSFLKVRDHSFNIHNNLVHSTGSSRNEREDYFLGGIILCLFYLRGNGADARENNSELCGDDSSW